ncbi:hypothetical protein HZB02_05275 [Candidatus Woesearchaeota archaeon]|nr:hypothetical protein [Candidatus Woesearchaeota archaeon]
MTEHYAVFWEDYEDGQPIDEIPSIQLLCKRVYQKTGPYDFISTKTGMMSAVIRHEYLSKLQRSVQTG